MEEASYLKLAEHLDRLPGGFAPSETGADIRLLKRLFTPEEAKLATYLTLDREEAGVIARRADLLLAEVEQRLEEMSEKGLIFSVQKEDGAMLYQAAPFVVGIYEFQVNRLTEGLLQDLNDFWSTKKPRSEPKSIPQMRTIPIGKTIDPATVALPYEQVYEMVNAHDRFAVATCICRRKEKKMGRGCDAPMEACLMFGDFADFSVRIGTARTIEKSEVMEILAMANEANLILRPSTSKRIEFLCCCCVCCCGGLVWLDKIAKPSEAVLSSFIARFDAESCINCGTCLERCQMKAITPDGDSVSLNPDRCIGCGLCVSTCQGGALTLERKPGLEQTEIPDTFSETWRTIALDRLNVKRN